MSRYIRAFGFFSLGLGISLVIGYWLKQEELRSRQLGRRMAAGNLHEADEPLIVLSQKTLATPPDDLTRIHGIGEKTAAVLSAAGIRTYAALAAASAAELLPKLEGVRGVNAQKVSAWIEQAKEYSA